MSYQIILERCLDNMLKAHVEVCHWKSITKFSPAQGKLARMLSTDAE